MNNRIQIALTVALFSALSAAWSWPLVCDPLDHLVSGVDTWGTVWTAGVAQQLDGGLHTSTTDWPDGQGLRRADSMLMLLVLSLGPGWIPLLVSLMVLLGPVLSALAAERFAVEVLGARWPHSLIAGVAYGFAGAAAGALVGGQAYVLVNPWLPLLAWSWWRAGQPEGTPGHGVVAGLSWALAMATSAYVGLCATVVVLVLGADTLRRGARPVRPWAGAAAVAIPAGLVQVWLFGSGQMRSGEAEQTVAVVREVMAGGSATLTGWLAWTPGIGAACHAWFIPLGWVTVALVAFAPVVLSARRGWRVWAVLGLVGVALSLGPFIRVHSDFLPRLPWLLEPVVHTPMGRWVRFPARFAWVGTLGLGAVAAVVASELATRRPRLSGLLWVAALLEVSQVTGSVARTAPVPSRAPAVYASLPQGSVVLDLFPTVMGMPFDHELLMADLSCAWQAEHGHTIATRCLDTALNDDTRSQASDWLHDKALQGARPDALSAHLAELGITTVVWFPDAYVPHDAAVVGAALEAALGAPVAESDNAGLRAFAFSVR